MRQRRHRRGQLNNKGLSIVEVVIAVTILSVIAISVANIILTAMTYNGKARKQQDATSVGESVLESFKAYGIDRAGLDYYRVNNADGSITFQKSAYDEDNRKFDVKVEVRPKRSVPLPDFGEMEGDSSFVVTELTSYTEEAYYGVLQQVADKLNDLNEMPDILFTPADLSGRDIKIHAVERMIQIADGPVATYKLRFHYSAVDCPYYDAEGNEHLYNNATAPDVEKYWDHDDVFEWNAEGELHTVYVYYYPSYGIGSVFTSGVKDCFTILSDVDSEMDLVLLKQKNLNYSDAEIAIGETNNRVEYAGYLSPQTAGKISLYHNWSENIGSESGVMGTPSGWGEFRTVSDYRSKTEEYKVLYDVVVSVYEHSSIGVGAGELHTQLEGMLHE